MLEDSGPSRFGDDKERPPTVVREMLFVEVGKRHQMLLHGHGVRQGFGWLVKFVRFLKTGSPGNLEAAGGSAKQNAAAAPQPVSALEDRIQQVKDAIYRYDPLHGQISQLQTAIGRAQGTVKNRREQLWQSQEALTKAQDHLWELQRRLEEVTQRKEEDHQGYEAMDLQDGPDSWWDADSPCLDDEEAHTRQFSPQSWRSWGGYHYQPRQDWRKSQCALEDLSVKFAEMQQYTGHITTQYSTFQTEVMLAIQALTHQQNQSVSVDGHGAAAPVTPRASPQPV